jgi:hypothetical protein
MKDRNKIIDECINVIKELTRDNCSDHTPYCGECISCGRSDNPEILPDPDHVLSELKKLKKETYDEKK